MGHNVIYSDTVKAFPQPEQAHADMQILTINNTVFVLQECEKLKTLPYKENLIICKNKAGKKYPENILLNFLFFNNKLYGKVSAIDPTLYKYCVKNDIEIVNINQGENHTGADVNLDSFVLEQLAMAEPEKLLVFQILLFPSSVSCIPG